MYVVSRHTGPEFLGLLFSGPGPECSRHCNNNDFGSINSVSRTPGQSLSRISGPAQSAASFWVVNKERPGSVPGKNRAGHTSRPHLTSRRLRPRLYHVCYFLLPPSPPQVTSFSRVFFLPYFQAFFTVFFLY